MTYDHRSMREIFLDTLLLAPLEVEVECMRYREEGEGKREKLHGDGVYEMLIRGMIVIAEN